MRSRHKLLLSFGRYFRADSFVVFVWEVRLYKILCQGSKEVHMFVWKSRFAWDLRSSLCNTNCAINLVTNLLRRVSSKDLHCFLEDLKVSGLIKISDLRMRKDNNLIKAAAFEKQFFFWTKFEISESLDFTEITSACVSYCIKNKVTCDPVWCLWSSDSEHRVWTSQSPPDSKRGL